MSSLIKKKRGKFQFSVCVNAGKMISVVSNFSLPLLLPTVSPQSLRNLGRKPNAFGATLVRTLRTWTTAPRTGVLLGMRTKTWTHKMTWYDLPSPPQMLSLIYRSKI